MWILTRKKRDALFEQLKAKYGGLMLWVARDILDKYFDVGEKGDVESFENLLG